LAKPFSLLEEVLKALLQILHWNNIINGISRNHGFVNLSPNCIMQQLNSHNIEIKNCPFDAHEFFDKSTQS